MQKDETKNLILSSPLLNFEQKNHYIGLLELKSEDELSQMAESLKKSEQDLLAMLEKAGLDMEEFQIRLKRYLRKKISKLEMDIDMDALEDIENQLKNL